jgi:hypothetical protein
VTPEISGYWELAVQALRWLGLVAGVVFIIMSEVVPSSRNRKPLQAIGVVLNLLRRTRAA